MRHIGLQFAVFWRFCFLGGLCRPPRLSIRITRHNAETGWLGTDNNAASSNTAASSNKSDPKVSAGTRTQTGTGTFGPRDASVSRAGLVAWWSGDGTVLDLAGKHSAMLFSGADFASGRRGQAFRFNGVGSRISVADSPDLKLTHSLSIQAWIFITSFRGDGLILFRGDDRSGLDPYTLSTIPTGKLRFHVESLNATTHIDAVIAAGRWNHIAATLDDKTNRMTIYINGQLASQVLTSVRPFADLDAKARPGIGIGNHGGFPGTSYNYPFHGRIDELKIYSRALSTAEIQASYKQASYKQASYKSAGADNSTLNR